MLQTKQLHGLQRPDIAIVDSTGTVTATGSGKAIITATTADGGLSASCMITVN